MKLLIVVDMQKDFIDGALGTAEAVKIVPAVQAEIEAARRSGTQVVFTRDTHFDNYMQTQEGKNLPVPHCIKGTEGWHIDSALDTADSVIFDKSGFGSVELVEYVSSLNNLEEAELIGLCTDICVITNAMMLKGALPELPLVVNSSCCAGVTPESHQNALDAMKLCQIRVIE